VFAICCALIIWEIDEDWWRLPHKIFTNWIHFIKLRSKYTRLLKLHLKDRASQLSCVCLHQTSVNHWKAYGFCEVNVRMQNKRMALPKPLSSLSLSFFFFKCRMLSRRVNSYNRAMAPLINFTASLLWPNNSFMCYFMSQALYWGDNSFASASCQRQRKGNVILYYCPARAPYASPAKTASIQHYLLHGRLEKPISTSWPNRFTVIS